jgi:UDP-glucose 4-epimerase
MSGRVEWFAGKQVLVTGGLGFIGSALAHRLVALGAKVTLIDSLIPEYGGNLLNVRGIEDRVRINISDIRDVHSLRYLVRDMDLIFNLAGQTSHLDSMRQPIADLEINCAAQLSLLETLRQHNPTTKIVFASTRQIYGKPDYLPVDEKHLLRPTDVNGINKMAGEWYHILYNNVYGLRATALRLTNTYGPRMRVKDARQTFLGIWIKLALEGQPFEVWGGDQLRDFSYVDDAVAPDRRTGLQPLGRQRGESPPGGRHAGDGKRRAICGARVSARAQGHRHWRLLCRRPALPRLDGLAARGAAGRRAQAHPRLLPRPSRRLSVRPR